MQLGDWTNILDPGKEVDVIYMDFQKAFDTVPHKRLIEKIKTFGIEGLDLCWIQRFLESRTQSVCI